MSLSAPEAASGSSRNASTVHGFRSPSDAATGFHPLTSFQSPKLKHSKDAKSASYSLSLANNDGAHIPTDGSLALPQSALFDCANSSGDQAPLSDTLGVPFSLDKPSNKSNTSLANSENNFETKQVSFEPTVHHADDIHSAGVDEEASTGSETSSQFSFVKDKGGGRNTSVKYYKTIKTPSENDNSFSQINTFNEHDLGYEVDEFSDYDFENNGLDEDLEYGDDQDGDVQYNSLFKDDDEQDESIRKEREFNAAQSLDSTSNHVEESSAPSLNTFERMETETASTDTKFPDVQLSKYKPFNHSYHLSIEGIDLSKINDKDIVHDSHSGDDLPEEDILENYLDSRRLSSADVTSFNLNRKTPDLQSSVNLELFDLNSPLINGLTIGNNLRHRLPRTDNFSKDVDTDSNTNRLFIFRQSSESGKNENNSKSVEPNYSVRPDSDVFKKRALKSFHSSISDNLDCRIIEKLNELERFNATRAESITAKDNEKDIGLGILVESDVNDEDIQNTEEKSINDSSETATNEIMNILESLEPTQSSATKKELNEVINNPNQQDQTPENPQNINRQSILGMMSVLENLHKVDDDQTQGLKISSEDKTTEKQRRSSIIDMMNNLSSLESENPHNIDASKRNSISQMMSTLATLEQSNTTNNAILGTEGKPNKFMHLEVKDPIKRVGLESKDNNRYSWYGNDETINLKASSVSGAAVPSSMREKLPLNDNSSPHAHKIIPLDSEIPSFLEKDLIDEANQLPEDYNFEDHRNKNPILTLNESNFYRSNSYNNKPAKTISDNNYLSSKIETINKTITFYRSNSTGQYSDFNRSRSISRGPSTRSLKSSNSIDSDSLNEGISDAPDNLKINVPNGPYTFRSNITLSPQSTDSFKNSNSLGTISEADSPFL